MLDLGTDERPDRQTSLINLRLLAAVSAFASKEEARYMLMGVHLEIEETGTTYVATDGHRLFCIRDDLPPGAKPNLLIGGFTVPTEHCKVFKPGKDDDGYAKVFGGARLTIAYGFVDLTFAPIDGDFPAWRRAVPPRPASGDPGQYNHVLLADFTKASVALGLSTPVLAQNGAAAPGFIWFPGHLEAMGMLMPHKSTDEQSREPPLFVREAPEFAEGSQFDLEAAIDKTNVSEHPTRKRADAKASA